MWTTDKWDSTVVATIGATFSNFQICIVAWCGDNSFLCNIKVCFWTVAGSFFVFNYCFHYVQQLVVCANAHNSVNFWNVCHNFVFITFSQTACNYNFQFWVFKTCANSIENIFNCFFFSACDKATGIDNTNISFCHISCSCVASFQQAVGNNVTVYLVFRAT